MLESNEPFNNSISSVMTKQKKRCTKASVNDEDVSLSRHKKSIKNDSTQKPVSHVVRDANETFTGRTNFNFSEFRKILSGRPKKCLKIF